MQQVFYVFNKHEMLIIPFWKVSLRNFPIRNVCLLFRKHLYELGNESIFEEEYLN